MQQLAAVATAHKWTLRVIVRCLPTSAAVRVSPLLMTQQHGHVAGVRCCAAAHRGALCTSQPHDNRQRPKHSAGPWADVLADPEARTRPLAVPPRNTVRPQHALVLAGINDLCLQPNA